MSEEVKPTQGRADSNRAIRMILGLGLMLPAILCCISGMLLPTFSTFMTSLKQWNGFGSGEFIGLQNYQSLFGDQRFGSTVTFTLLMIAVRLLAVAILPMLLGLGVHAFGRAIRIPARLAFTVPLALYAPVALALSWLLVFNPALGMAHEPLFATSEMARTTLLLIDGLFVLGLAAGLGLIVYLAALRGPGEEAPSFKQVRRPLIAAWSIGLLATIALTLQAFDWSYVLTDGGPLNSTMTLALYQYKMAFERLQFGFGAAVASVSLLIILMLGLVVGLIVVSTGLRLDLASPAKSPQGIAGSSKAIFGATMALASVCGIVVCLVNTGVLSAGFTTEGKELADLLPVGRILLGNTIALQALPVLLIQIPLTYLAALGIGGLRPLGKRSEWLLIAFSPWLFVTTGPLMVALYQQLRSVEMLDTSLALANPLWISVPILFVLTLFFKGREQPYQEAVTAGASPISAFFSKVVRPSLPLAMLLALASILVRIQRFQWPLVVVTDPDLQTMPVTLVMLAGQYSAALPEIGRLISISVIPLSLFFLVAFGIFQVVYLDRLVLRSTGKASESSETAQVDLQTE